MLVLLVVGLCLLVAIGVIWAEARLEELERHSRTRHPAGRFCEECNFRIEDWDTHQRLVHRKRVTAPDDLI